MAARLQVVGRWDRSAVPLQERASTVYTMRRGRVIRQTIFWEHEANLVAELTDALDRVATGIVSATMGDRRG